MVREGMTVTLSTGKTVQVLPSTLKMALRMNRMRQEALGNPDPDIDTQAVKVIFYPPIVACTDCEFDSVEEFLSLPEEDTDLLYKAVQKVNPHWFPDGDGLKKKLNSAPPIPPAKKKKPRKRS